MTLAFSTKSGQWTTEYSFEPTCYANTDGRMIAFKDVDDGAFWLHDQDAGNRNKYYGTKYKSSLSVVSNENPSATKAYEAISLETSYGDWSVDVSTLNQEGTVTTFFDRENDQYAPIPKDQESFSSANLVYIGTTSGDTFISEFEAGEIKLSSMSGSIALGLLCFKNSIGDILAIRANGLSGSIQPDSTIGNVESFSESSRSIALDVKNPPTVAIGSGVPDQVQLFVAQRDSGESMKGDYLRVDIETKNVGPPAFELYAINVDQHKVNLDHSLGQNN